MGRAVAAATVSDLTGAPDVYAQTVESFDAAFSIPASRVLEGYFVERNGRLEIHATLQDAKSSKAIRSFEVDGPSAGGPLPLVNQLAKELSPGARAFETASAAVFRSFGEALHATDPAAAVRGFESATISAPGFSLAYLEWAKTLSAAGDREGALKVLESAQHVPASAIDRAELDYTAASIRGDASARESALDSLARLTPANPKVFEELAGLKVSQRKFQEAVRDYQAANRLNPDEPATWNELGYALAYAQDLEGARAALREYQELLPKENVNGLDSLGEVSFFLRDFEGAAKYFLEADQKNRGEFGGGELLKAAQARLMAGDLRSGDELFEKYAALFQGDRVAYQRAQWEFLTGRRKAAMARIEKSIATLTGDEQSVALSQLAIWKMETADSKAAADLANQAMGRAASALTRNLAGVCRVIAMSSPAPSGSKLADAYALVFARKFRDATPLLESLYRQTDPSRDGQLRTMLAWAYLETNRSSDADGLLRVYPIPFSSGESIFASLIFPRYLFLRGAVLERQGKRSDAKSAYQLFLKYAGDVPDVFGGEATARRNLAAL